MLRYLSSGESHGQSLNVIVEGFPSNVQINIDNINNQLKKRQTGYGRGDRMKIETDKAKILSGLRGSKTIGSPICIQIENKDYENWINYMDPINDIDKVLRQVTKARPGHADLSGSLKYDFDDIRNVLERASARETAVQVALGALCKEFLKYFKIEFVSHTVQIGKAVLDMEYDFDTIEKNVDVSDLRCICNKAEERFINEIKNAKENGDTLGGIFEIRIKNVPLGLGSYVQYDRKIDANLAFALMGIQAIKGVEFGIGFKNAYEVGSNVHDEIFYDKEIGIYRNTNNSGGIEGGMTNGEEIVIRCAMKPIPTLYKPLNSIDINTFENYKASIERSDTCAVSAAGVVGENVAAFVIMKFMLEKFGNENLKDIKNSYDKYMERLEVRGWKAR